MNLNTMNAHGTHGLHGNLVGIAPNWFGRFFFLLFLASLVLPATAQPIPPKVAHAPAAATLIPLSGNWRLDGDVPVHALLISLQGLANRGEPRIYLEYPKDWQWEIVRPLEGFLEKRHGIKFDRLAQDDAAAALTRFGQFAKGYVVWDKAVRSSLIVAFTISGVEDAGVVDKVVGLRQAELAAETADRRNRAEKHPGHIRYL